MVSLSGRGKAKKCSEIADPSERTKRGEAERESNRSAGLYQERNREQGHHKGFKRGTLLEGTLPISSRPDEERKKYRGGQRPYYLQYREGSVCHGGKKRGKNVRKNPGRKEKNLHL